MRDDGLKRVDLEHNPKVDHEVLRRAREIQEELASHGIRSRPDYDLVPALSGSLIQGHADKPNAEDCDLLISAHAGDRSP